MNSEQTAELLYHEIKQQHEEGYDTAEAQREWNSIGLPELRVHQGIPEAYRATAHGQAQRIEGLYRHVESGLMRRPAFSYQEPATLEEIRAARPDGPRQLDVPLDSDALRDRLLGAWLGRAAGCLLGKPVENWTRTQIRTLLEHAGEYPLEQYLPYLQAANSASSSSVAGAASGSVQGARPGSMPGVIPREEATTAAELVAHIARRPSDWYRGHITRMVRDDDMDYPLIAMHLLEQFGPSFTTENVGHAWRTKLPYLLVYTAERVAYANLVNGLTPPETASYRNPYREWIGAQIRADVWGWVCPGRPEQAATLAYRDAALSHTKNGIYGEMFFAAALAALFAVDTVEAALRIGLTEIPANTRFAEAVRNTLEWVKVDGDFQKTTDRIHEAYGAYHSVHTINNAALVAMGVLYAEQGVGGDPESFEPSICLTVMGGWDTDCTGATAGSLAGARIGARALPKKWVGDFHDRLESIVIGMTDNRFTDLADRTLLQARRLTSDGFLPVA